MTSRNPQRRVDAVLCRLPRSTTRWTCPWFLAIEAFAWSSLAFAVLAHTLLALAVAAIACVIAVLSLADRAHSRRGR